MPATSTYPFRFHPLWLAWSLGLSGCTEPDQNKKAQEIATTESPNRDAPSKPDARVSNPLVSDAQAQDPQTIARGGSGAGTNSVSATGPATNPGANPNTNPDTSAGTSGDPSEPPAGSSDARDASGAANEGGPLATERSRARVLFSGHSLMDNPIPDWVQSIADAKGDDLGWEEQIVIGSPISVRTRGSSGWSGYSQGKNREGQNKSMLAELAQPTAFPSSERYDTLLITERHDPLDSMQWEDTVPYLRHYHDRLAEQFPEARTIFYQCWPGLDKSNPEPWVRYQFEETLAWECAASKVNLSLERDGKPPSVSVLPASEALATLVQRALADEVPGVSGSTAAKMNQIFTDDVHLNDVGRYLMAAVIYSAVFGKSPVGAHAVPSIPEETATALEELAWQTVSEYAARTGASAQSSLEECRTRIASSLCPAYYAIRNRNAPGCDAWTGAGSPLSWPDESFPLPAP